MQQVCGFLWGLGWPRVCLRGCVNRCFSSSPQDTDADLHTHTERAEAVLQWIA